MELNTTFDFRCNAVHLAALDDYRRTLPDLPSRAEALRRLMLKAADEARTGQSTGEACNG